MQKRVATSTQLFETSTVQERNDNGKELQVMRKEQETMLMEKKQGTSSDEVPEISPSSLTAFVQHGVVTGDHA